MTCRIELKRLGVGTKHRFSAVVKQFGCKPGWRGMLQPTVLLVDVCIGSNRVADHIWLTVGKQLDNLNLKPNDEINFDATIKTYSKGYVDNFTGYNNQWWDWGLERPHKIIKLEKEYQESSKLMISNSLLLSHQ